MSKSGHEESEESREEIFAKKVGMWQKQTRGDWEWKSRPAYRQKTVNAALTQQSLMKKMKSDFESLDDVEAGLHAMSTFLEGKEETHETINQILDSEINVDDMIAMKRSVKEKIKRSGRSAKTDIFSESVADKSERKLVANEAGPIEVNSTDASCNADPVGETKNTRKPALLDMDGLKAARMHNKHRQLLLQHKKSTRGEQHATVTPSDHLVSAQKEPIEDFTFLTGVVDMVEPDHDDNSGNDDDDTDQYRKQHAKQVVYSGVSAAQPVGVKPRSLSAGPARSSSTGELSSGMNSAAGVLASRPLERSSVSVQNLQHIRTRPPRPPRQRQHTMETYDDEVPELAERQLEWLHRVEDKRRQMKRDLEFADLKELQMYPNVAKAQESWQKAKKAHAKEMSRELQNEALRKRLDDMKEEMHQMRIAEKAMRMKCYESEILLLQQQRKMAEGGSGATHFKKGKKVKVRRRRRRSADAARDIKRDGEDTSDKNDSDDDNNDGNDVVKPAHKRHNGKEKTIRPLSAGHAGRRPTGRGKTDVFVDVLDLVLSPSSTVANGGKKKKKKKGSDNSISGSIGTKGASRRDRTMKTMSRDNTVCSDKGNGDDDVYDDNNMEYVKPSNRTTRRNEAKTPEVEHRRTSQFLHDGNTYDDDEQTDDPYQFEDDTAASSLEAVGMSRRHRHQQHQEQRLTVGDDENSSDISRSSYNGSYNSAQSSEVFAHRIKELTDRDDVIAMKHERRHTRPSTSDVHYENDDDEGDTHTLRTTSAMSAGDDNNTYISNLTDRTPYDSAQGGSSGHHYVSGRCDGPVVYPYSQDYGYGHTHHNTYASSGRGSGGTMPSMSTPHQQLQGGGRLYGMMDATSVTMDSSSGGGGSGISSMTPGRNKFFDTSSTADKGRFRVHDARSAFSEENARKWWENNRERLLVI